MTGISGYQIVTALGGKWFGMHGKARCPAHADKTPSLHITQDGETILAHCHSGCSQSDVIKELARLGLWDSSITEVSDAYILEIERSVTRCERIIDSDAQLLRNIALKIWNSSISIDGTICEKYLTGRGIITYSNQIRFHPLLDHPNGFSYPAMIAAITNNSGLLAIQRTYMTVDGQKLPSGIDRKLSLGPQGSGSVRLSEPRETIGLAETLFSLPVWATLGTSRLKTAEIQIPDNISNIIIFGDNGKSGHQAAKLGAANYQSMGFNVQVVFPPDKYSDFNDILTERKI
jgi:putative DNA primase/helicase